MEYLAYYPCGDYWIHKVLMIPNDTSVLDHRGPDDSGWYLNERIYLAHRRLSIIDLTTGKTAGIQ